MLFITGEMYSPLAPYKGHSIKEITGFNKLFFKGGKFTGFIVIPGIEFEVIFLIYFVIWALAYNPLHLPPVPKDLTILEFP